MREDSGGTRALAATRGTQGRTGGNDVASGRTGGSTRGARARGDSERAGEARRRDQDIMRRGEGDEAIE